MYGISYIGNSGHGMTPRVLREAHQNARNPNLVGDKNYNSLVNPQRKTVFNDPTMGVNKRLAVLHRDEKIADAVAKNKPMYQREPWNNIIELTTKDNPLAQARIYATNAGRLLDNMIVHGFRANLVPEGKMTSVESYANQAARGIAGQIDYAYNEAMFDKERDL